MTEKQLKTEHYFCHVKVILLLVLLSLSRSYADVVDPIPIDNVEVQAGVGVPGPGVDVKPKGVDSSRSREESQSQLSDAHAVPPNIPLAKLLSSDDVNTEVKPAAAGPVGPSEDDKTEPGYANEVKPTKSDWFYNPQDEEDLDSTWDDESSYEKEDLDNSASTATSVSPSFNDDEDEENEDDEDDEDEANFDLWAKLRDHDKEQNSMDEEEEEEKGGDEAELNQDFDEKFHDDVVDEDLVKNSKPPTAPSKMVLFYTWMILAVLIMVIGISTYQARCKGLHLNSFRHSAREDRKRLVDHEYT